MPMKTMLKNRNARVITIFVLLVISLMLPMLLTSEYVLRILVMCFIYAILAASLNLLSGITGLISLGHAGFYAVGAYTSALFAIRLGWPVWTGLLLAAVVAGLFGLFIAWPATRLSGGYLAIVTLAFAEVIRLLIINFVELTNGNIGLMNIPQPEFFGLILNTCKRYYYYALIVLVVVLVLIANLVNSRFGRNLKAIKSDEIAAEVSGVNLHGTKVLVFVISAAIAGMAGSLYAHLAMYIDPKVFTTDVSMTVLGMVVLGGMGNQVGAVVSAFGLTILPELLRGLDRYRMLFYGVLLVAAMLIQTVDVKKALKTKLEDRKAKKQMAVEDQNNE